MLELLWELKPDVLNLSDIKIKTMERSWRDHYPFAHFWNPIENVLKE